MSGVSDAETWIIHEASPDLAAQIASQHNLSPIAAQVLINRGILFEEKYVFSNIRSTTDQANALLRKVLQSPPYPVVDFSAPHSDESQPLEITLWGREEDREDWMQFFKEHDRPAQPAHPAD